MRRLWPTLIVAVSLVAAGACAQVPGSSPPVTVREVQGPADDSQAQSLAEPPKAGMTSTAVVEGFLNASSVESTNRYPVTREYLADSTAVWPATDPVTVYESGYAPREDGAQDPDRRTVEVNLMPVATVSQDGAYTPSQNDEPITEKFELRRVEGEWRISDPPSRLYIKKEDFNLRYRPVNVYFLSRDAARPVVVPDTRYFSVPKQSLPNRLVEALLDGPSEWLGPAVSSALPQGAELRQNVLNTSPMEVDFTGIDALTDEKLQRMSAQIVWTLSQTEPIINAGVVRIMQDGHLLDVAGVGEDQQKSDWQEFDPAAQQSTDFFSVHNGAVWRNTEPLEGPAGTGQYDLSAIAVSQGSTTPGGNGGASIAGIRHTDHGDELYVGPLFEELEKIYSAPRLTTPTWAGGRSQVWTVRDGKWLVRVPLTGEVQIINSDDLSDIHPIRALRMSLDGTRVAAIGKGGTLYLGRVRIGENWWTIDGLRNIAPSISGVTAVSWNGSDSLAALAPTTGSSQVVPWEIKADGSVAEDQPVSVLPGTPTGIAAAQDRSLMTSANGQILSYGQAEGAPVWRPVMYGGEPTADPPVRGDKELLGTAPTYTD